MFTIVPLIGTTDSDGAAVIQAAHAVNGLLFGFIEDKGSFDDGVDLTLAVVNSEFTATIITLTNADTDNQAFFPRTDSCGNTGTALIQNQMAYPVVGKLQLTVAQGGDTKTGGIYAWILE